jgi:hypothetical protein
MSKLNKILEEENIVITSEVREESRNYTNKVLGLKTSPYDAKPLMANISC